MDSQISFYVANNADIVNKGIEASLNWRGESGDFKYGIGGVFAYNRNEVAALAPGTVGVRGGYINVTPATYTVVGHSIGEFYGRRVTGIFTPEIPTATQRFNNLGEVYNNITSQGVDTNVYPMAAVYNFGININL